MITNLVGTRIRILRAERNFTQQQLADLANIPRATIASVEKDDANPSLMVVYKIAVALGVTVDELVVEDSQRVQIVRGEQMRRIKSGDGDYRATVLSPPNACHFLQQQFSLQPRSTYNGKPHPPGSEEYLYVLQGKIELEVADESVCLKQGDSARFGGNVYHKYSNPTPDEAFGLVTILEIKGGAFS